MSRAVVRVRELAAWGFDDYAYRPSIEHACICGRPAFAPQPPLVPESDTQRDALQLEATRPDLLDDVEGLHWSLGIVTCANCSPSSAGSTSTTRPCFFAEVVLFSAHPPRVTDFLDDTLNLHYSRPALIKTLRLTIDESVALQAPSGESL